ncbi:MAG: MafI family immunity protein [Neisseriaceae bacterium]|nr:MafI family immunity protein [Neisseriaceae bacterium]
MIVNEKIKEFGQSLKDRLDPELINYALAYIDYSEQVLAFETLCDHIADYGIDITVDEYSKVLEIVKLLNLELDNRYLYINPNKQV